MNHKTGLALGGAPRTRSLARLCVLMAATALGCGGSAADDLPRTIELEQVTTLPGSNVISIPLLQRDGFVVWPAAVSEDGGATLRTFSNGVTVAQIAEREAGAAYAVRLVTNHSTTPLAIWDYKGNQFFPLPAGSEAAPVAAWAARSTGGSTSIFAVTDQSNQVWRLAADWTAMPLPSATEKAALITVVAGRVVVWGRSGELYALEVGATEFKALGVKVPAANALHSLSDGRLAIVSVGQPDKLHILGLDDALLPARNLPLSGGESRLETCRNDLLAVGGQHSTDLGVTWTSPLDMLFPLAFAGDAYRQESRCYGPRVFQVVIPKGGDPVSVEIGADGTLSMPTDPLLLTQNTGARDVRLLGSDQLAVHYPLPQRFQGGNWTFADAPQLPLLARDGTWHAYSWGGQDHFTSPDGVVWKKGAATHDGQPGAHTGNMRGQYFAGQEDEIWAVTGNQTFTLTGTLTIEYHLSRSSDGAAFKRVAESKYSQDAETSIEIGKRLDVVGVSQYSEVATKSQFAADGKTFRNFSFPEKAAGIFAYGRLLTQRITYTKNGNRIDFVVRDQAGFEVQAWTPTRGGAEFRNELEVIGIDDKDRIWLRCATGSPDICRTAPPE